MIATSTAMLIATAASAATSTASAISQSKAAGKARKTLSEQATLSAQRLAPWREAGERALADLEQKVGAGPGEFEASPGYQFRKAEGEKAISRAASARGGLWSGAHTKRLIQYGQNVASDEFDRFESRFYKSLAPLQQMAGMGQAAAAGTVQAEQQTARDIAGTYIGGGEAKGAGFVNVGNVVRSGMRDYITLSEMAKKPTSTPSVSVTNPNYG